MDAARTSDVAEAVPIDRGLVAVQDGRSIGWTAWGSQDGETVIDQPHLGDSGQRALTMDVAPLADAGIRIVVVCRAGLGPSTRYPGRTEMTDAEDMLRVIDALGLDEAHLLGECGGTGAALALAARWPDRVRALALVSSMVPLTGTEANAYLTRPLRQTRQLLRFGPIARWTARAQVRAFDRDPVGFGERTRNALPGIHRAFMDDPTRRAWLLASSAEFYASPERFLDEWRSVLQPWAFDISAVRSPVIIDHGGQDMTAPVGMASWLSERLTSVDLRIDPGRGHFMAPDRLAGILRRLVALGPAS